MLDFLRGRVFPGCVLPLLLLTGMALAVMSCALSGETRDRRMTMYDGEGILQIADRYLGVPYRPGGHSPEGFDCSGFTSFVFSKAGYTLARTADGQYDALRPVEKPQPGDLVFFRISGKRVSHVGIYAGDLKFIHAPSSGKKVEYSDMRIAYWKERYAGARTVFR